MKKVSTIIPVYNSEKYLEATIESAILQTYRSNEIIVINDGSTDQSAKIIEKFSRHIIYIEQQNQGVAIARNTGIKKASGEYIAFLDSDDLWLPNKLEMQVETMNNNNNIQIVHTDITPISEEGRPLEPFIRDANRLTGFLEKNLLLRKAHIACSTAMARKDSIVLAGMFDPFLSKIGAEDLDLWVRLAKSGPAEYINIPLALYRVRDTSLSHNRPAMITGRMYITDKYYPSSYSNLFMRANIKSAIFLENGDEDYWKEDYRQAIITYCRSILFFPLNIIAYLRICKSIIKSVYKITKKRY